MGCWEDFLGFRGSGGVTAVTNKRDIIYKRLHVSHTIINQKLQQAYWITILFKCQNDANIECDIILNL